MDKVLVIQMARLGDFMQTTPLIQGIKQSNPSCRIWVLIDKSLHDVALHCPCVDEILTIDTVKLYRMAESTHNLVGLYEELKQKCAFLKELRFDCIYNVNFSPLTAYLSSIPQCPKVVGYSLCADRREIAGSPWFQFLNTIVKFAPLAPFNLVDFFTNPNDLGMHTNNHLHFLLSSAEQHAAEKRLYAHNISQQDCIIALQLSTRNIQRQWPLEYFSELAVKLLKNEGTHILLLGSKEDEKRAEIFKQQIMQTAPAMLKRIHDFVSKTTIPELAGLLSLAQLLISCDTGTIHIAAAVDCKILALFFGPARVEYTGPYGRGHWILQVSNACSPCIEDKPTCDDYLCTRIIKPDTVVSAAQHIIYNRALDAELPKDVTLLTSYYDKWGILYEPVDSRPLTLIDIQNVVYREMGKKILDQSYCPDLLEFEDTYRYLSNTIKCYTAIFKSVLMQGRKLINSYYTNHYELQCAALNDDMSFWHPWIDYYLCAIRYGTQQQVQSIFVSGLHAATELLSKLAESQKSTVKQVPQHETAREYIC